MLCDICAREAGCPLRELSGTYSASLGINIEITACRQYQETPQHRTMREFFYGDNDEPTN